MLSSRILNRVAKIESNIVNNWGIETTWNVSLKHREKCRLEVERIKKALIKKYRFVDLNLPSSIDTSCVVEDDTYIRFEDIVSEIKKEDHPALKNFMFNWRSIREEDDCLEIPSKIYKPSETRDYLIDYFALRKYLMKKAQLEESSIISQECEGGGHIHISLDFLKKNKRLKTIQYKEPKLVKRFFKNLLKFQINNPWLHWSFNSPIDVENAYINFWACNEFIDNDITEKYNYRWKYNSGTSMSTQIKIIDNSPCNPYIESLPIKYRQNYNTVEFRMFIMPRTIEENLLHIEFAHKVINHIWQISQDGVELAQKYRSSLDYSKISYKESLAGLHSIMKTLKIPKYRYDMKVALLKDRYSYVKSKDYLK